MSRESEGLKISLTELNPHFVCVLCFGYFVDAATITECMHTFCKSCIVNFLSTNHHCPHCDTLLSRTRPLSSLRLDRIMQALVYKTVPGLFQTEMRRRLNFYHNQSDTEPALLDFKNDVEDLQNYIFSSDDSISLVIQYNNKCTPEGKLNESKLSSHYTDGKTSNYSRYFRCPATVPVHVLKVLIKMKHHIPDSLRVELLYGEERLLDSWTLMEVAYIFRWPRESPMTLSFQIFATRKVKKKKLVFKKRLVAKSNSLSKPKKRTRPERETSNVVSEKDGPIKKLPKLVVSGTLSSNDEPHPRPPTPPETPERMPHEDNYYNTQQLEKFNSNCLNERGKSTHELRESNTEKETSCATTKNSSTTKPVLKDEICSNENDYGADQDSEGSLEVDFSHVEVNENGEDENTVEEKTMNESHPQGTHSLLGSLQSSGVNCNDINTDDGIVSMKNCSDRQNGVKSKVSINDNSRKKNFEQTNVKTGTDINDIGVLDLSYHARTVRAKKVDDTNTPSPSPSPPFSDMIGINSLAKGSALSSVSATIGNRIDFKNKSILHNNTKSVSLAPNNKLPLNWPAPSSLQNPALGSHTTTAFRDLVTLSHAAVQLQIAMAHAQAQAQVHVHAQKLQENVLQKLKASESLSFINGSGDTLTISPIPGAQVNGRQKTLINKSGKKCAKIIPGNKSINTLKDYGKLQNQVLKKRDAVNGGNAGPMQSFQNPGSLTGKSSALNSPLRGDNTKSNKIPTKINATLKSNSLTGVSNKHSTLSKNLTSLSGNLKAINNAKPSIPKTALSSLKIPLVKVNTCKITANMKTDKDKKIELTRSGDEVFKITNQKLIECFRQQHNNKLKNSMSPKSGTNDSYLSSVKVIPELKPSDITGNNESMQTKQLSDTNSSLDTSEKSVINEKVTNLPAANSPSLNSEVISATNSKSNTITPALLSGLKVTTTSCNAHPIITNSVRTTNTCIRQIPNPSRLHQQSVSRLSLGSSRPLITGKRPYNTSTGDRLESLTRTLHKKVAASAAGIVTSLAR